MKLNQSADALLAELKANPRLRWGLWTIVGVIWLYGVLAMHDEVQEKRDSYLALSKRVARIQGTATQSEWSNRLGEAKSLQLNLENRLWREGTIGLAQATFHDWLYQSAQQASLGNVQLLVAAQDDESEGSGGKGSADGGTRSASDLWRVSAKLSFDFNPQSFYPLLARIASHEKRVSIESLTIRSTPTPKAELLLVAYFLKPPAAETRQSNDRQ
ncbi:hypothetical protein GALL_110080 [mine drainage metagenome]|uniref:Uncharacterized protein n=1 Tax=mine drainage metagenome TaxID=410659 RepID=A0A1J5SRV8_9ZZZZ